MCNWSFRIPSDNRLENIKLGTQSQNSMDRPKEERLAHGKHAASFRRKLTEGEVVELRDLRDQGWIYSDLCKKYDISKTAVSYIVNNKTYTNTLS